MDILKEIELQINSIRKVDSSNYLDSIFTHIERAEYYYKQGKSDSNFFNDVIYRSNQAYEGALKESYKVLADKKMEEVMSKTPNDIERYFETNNIFKDRVLQLFKNYRQEWRNKSTHDYKLFFDENEAFIALMSVTSFVHVLLKQILEKTAYLTQHNKLREEKIYKKFEMSKEILNSKNPTELLINIIFEFSKLNSEQLFKRHQEITEAEVLGLFHAFLESVSDEIKIQREPAFQLANTTLRPDFLIEINKDRFILEFKRMRNSDNRAAIQQVLTYMQAAKTSNGIIYHPNFNEPRPDPKVTKAKSIIDKESYFITTVTT